MKILRLIFACWLVSVISAFALTPSNIVDEITRLSYENVHTNLFVHTNENRGFNTSVSPCVPANQHDLARDYILSSFTNVGLSAALDPFGFSNYTNCNNVVATKPGLNPSNYGYYVIGAHYDSVNSSSCDHAGANDNASGVAGVLEIARVLSAYTFKATLIFIAFDAEEEGLYGSEHYVDDSTTSTNGDPLKICRTNVRSMISMDMIAYNPAGVNSNKAQIYGGDSIVSKPVRTNLANALVQYGGLSFDNSGANNSSDHGPFYYGGMDACLLIEYNHNSDEYYHEVGDAVDTANYIDYEFAAKMTKAVAGYLCSQAGLVPPASAMTVQPVPAGTNFVMTWDSMAGLVQQVEYRDGLTGSGSWTTLGTYTNVDGAWALTITDQVEDVSLRFYRVQSW